MNRAYNTLHEKIRPNEQPAVTPRKKIVVKVRKNGWLTKGEKVIYSFLSIAFVISCFFVVSFASKVDMQNREVQNLELQVHNQEIENETLYFEVSELSSPDRITKIAKKHGLKIQDAKVKQAVSIGE